MWSYTMMGTGSSYRRRSAGGCNMYCTVHLRKDMGKSAVIFGSCHLSYAKQLSSEGCLCISAVRPC